MNIFAILFSIILFVCTLTVLMAVLLRTAEISKTLEIKFKEKVIERHMKKYKRRLFYGR